MNEILLNTNKQRRRYWEHSVLKYSASQLEQGLRTLKPDSGKVLKLHYYQGYSLTQIAQLMNRSIALVRNHHNRGIYKMYRHFNPRSKAMTFHVPGDSQRRSSNAAPQLTL